MSAPRRWSRRKAPALVRQRRQHCAPVVKSADGADAADVPGWVLEPEVMLIVRVPARPSRLKHISMSSMRRNVWARRSRPAKAPGLLGQPAPFFVTLSLAKWATVRRRSEAVPTHLARSAISLRISAIAAHSRHNPCAQAARRLNG
jgi:hypothetical protein